MGMVSSPAKEYLGSLYVQHTRGRCIGCPTMTFTHRLQASIVVRGATSHAALESCARAVTLQVLMIVTSGVQ